jgi:hypothetical protein
LLLRNKPKTRPPFSQNSASRKNHNSVVINTPGTPSSKIDPDLIRSTSVEERNPEIYDQYCNKETGDEDSNA